VAAVDAKHQVVVSAQAFGEGQEHDLLKPMVEQVRTMFRSIGHNGDVFTTTRLTADAGYHTEANMQYVFEEGIDAVIADKQMRQRDPRFASASRHKVRHRKEHQQHKGRITLFRPQDFHHDAKRKTCVCPAGRHLYRNGSHITINDHTGVKYTGAKSVCGPCELRHRCLKHPDRTKVRQVVFFNGRTAEGHETFTEKMKRKVDSTQGQLIYRQRLATVEPVFGHLRHAKGLHRFTLRGKQKVNGQWQLYCTVHNLFKIHQYGSGDT